jgi:hypothetical protein
MSDDLLRGTSGDDADVRLLRAKVAELESRAGRHLAAADPGQREAGYLAADVALIARVLADQIEYRRTGRPLARNDGPLATERPDARR